MPVVNEDTTRSEILKSMQAHCRGLQGHRVYLFGSRARGDAGRSSDFDIGIDGSEPLDLAVLFKIKDSLEQIPTLYQFDLVDLNRASPKLRENARREGRLLYEA